MISTWQQREIRQEGRKTELKRQKSAVICRTSAGHSASHRRRSLLHFYVQYHTITLHIEITGNKNNKVMEWYNPNKYL
jgi:hypothetical protein